MIMPMRKGLALLLVLASLTLVTSSLALLTLGAAQSHRAVRVADRERLAADLLQACEPLTRNWLKTESRHAVVDPEAAEPRVPIASVAWRDDTGRPCTVQIAAWDLHGMLHPKTSSASPLWLALPDAYRDAAWLEAPSLYKLDTPDLQVYPTTDGESEAIGGHLAFSPAPDRRGRRSSIPTTPIININTAPRKLLEEAMRLAQRGGIESVLEARREGRPATVPTRTTEPKEGGPFVELTGQSALWAVRTDAAIDGVTRSWWTVYTAGEGGFDILERHAIGE